MVINVNYFHQQFLLPTKSWVSPPGQACTKKMESSAACILWGIWMVSNWLAMHATLCKDHTLLCLYQFHAPAVYIMFTRLQQ